MSQLIWTPGAAGPLDEFVGRLTRMARDFAEEQRLDAAEVRIELVDGRHYLVASAAPEPGFGFFCIVPHLEVDEGPRKVVIPVGAVKLIEFGVPDPEAPLGFSVPDA